MCFLSDILHEVYSISEPGAQNTKNRLRKGLSARKHAITPNKLFNIYRLYVPKMSVIFKI